MKKILAALLAVITIFGCCTVAAFAEEPEASPSGLYIGKVIAVGETVTTALNASQFTVTYSIATEDVEKVSSALGTQFAPDLAMAQFRDDIAGFVEYSDYKGVYPLKGQGDEMMSMRVNDGTYKSKDELDFGVSASGKKNKMPEGFEIKIDYEHTKDTYYQYTTITGWKVVKFTDNANNLDISLEAVWTTREPTSKEAFTEKMYAKYMEIRAILLDIMGNFLLKAVPDFFKAVASIFKFISK